MRRLWRTTRGKITVITVITSTLGIGMLLVVFWTVDEVIRHEPSLSVEVSELPVVSAKAFMVLDVASATEILSKNSDESLPIASITKLFTAAAFRDHTDLVGSTTVTWGDVITEGGAGKLSAGEVYPYNELVQALLVESSNDAATTIGRADAEVITRMNEYPANLGFGHTTFDDTSGLSSKNKSSAYELAYLTLGVWNTQPYLFDVTNMEQIIGTHTGWINNNPFIGTSGYKGGKHGFTYEAGRTASVIFTESLAGTERDFLYVALGSDDLVSDIEQLRSHVRKHVTYE